LKCHTPKPTTNRVNAQGDLVASDTNVFGNADINLNRASKLGILLAVTGKEIVGLPFSYTILGADTSLTSKVKQNIEFSPTDYIRFDFSDQVKYEGSFTDSITTLAGSPVNVEFPLGRTDTITVTPTVLLKNEFHNKYVHSENNRFEVEAGTFSAEIPGVPLLPFEISIPWICSKEVCALGVCVDVPYFCKKDVGPYTTPSFDIGPFGPAYKASPSYDPEVTVVDQTFELGGFEEKPLPSFALDPQVKPYPVPLPAEQDPYEVNEGSTIVLDGSQSYDLDGDPIRLYWDLDNDGVFETEGSTPSYLGTEGPGVYTIWLMANDPYGYQVAETTVTVYNVAPTASIVSMTQPNPQFILPIVHELAFDGNFTDPGWLDSHTSTWNFGDGTLVLGTLTEENDYPNATGTTTAEHIYSDPGTYIVTLTVTDDDDGVGTDTMPVTVVDAKTANQELSDYIQGLDDGNFKNNADQRKNAFANMLMAIDAMLDEEAYQGARGISRCNTGLAK
jgi:PKD repeat protein